MERTLVMKFKDNEGKSVSISVPEVRDNITEKDVVELMDTILTKKSSFAYKNNLATKSSAQIVEKQESEIYKAL